jgi:hypothetical protein
MFRGFCRCLGRVFLLLPRCQGRWPLKSPPVMPWLPPEQQHQLRCLAVIEGVRLSSTV